MKNVNKLLSRILFVGSFLVPVAFSPLTVEYFESAKVILLSLMTLIGMGIWAYVSIKDKRFVVQRSKFIVSFLLFVGAVILSFLFSQDKIVSEFGYFGRLINSLPFYLLLGGFFFTFSNLIDSKRQFKSIVAGLVWGLTSLAVFILIQHFRVIPESLSDEFAFLTDPSFNPMGSAFLVPFVLSINIALAGLLYKLSESKYVQYHFIVAVIVNIFTITVTAGDPLVGQNWIFYAFLGLLALITFLVNHRDRKFILLFVSTLSASLLISLLITNVNPFKSALKLDSDPYVRESTLGFAFGWEIMGETLAASPQTALFGSGPDTFIEAFSKYKPLEYNSTNFWSVRLSRGSGEFMEMLSNLGIMPFLVFGLIILVAIRVVYQAVRVDSVHSAEIKDIGIALLLVIVLGFFSAWNTVIWYIMLVLLVGLSVLDRMSAPEDSEMGLSLDLSTADGQRKDFLPVVFVGLFLVISVLSLNFLTRSYLSDVKYKKALRSASEEEYEEALQYAIAAVKWSRDKDYPHRQIALQSLALLEQISSEEKPDQNSQAAFLNQVLNETEKVLSSAPNNVENWETAAIIYQRLINLTDGQYGAESVNALQNAIRLDPNKPQLYEALGVLYARAEEYETAKQQIEYAINLLPGYFRPYLTLAEVYELEGDIETATKLLNAAKEVLPEDSEVISLIDEKIESLESGESTESIEEESIEDIVDEDADNYPGNDELDDFEESSI